jgi:hypothetical protein
VVENSAFEMPAAQDQRPLDGVELLRIIDLCRFERIEIRKHPRIRKEADAPSADIIDFAIEQEIVEGGRALYAQPRCHAIGWNPLPPANPILHAFAGKRRRRKC